MRTNRALGMSLVVLLSALAGCASEAPQVLQLPASAPEVNDRPPGPPTDTVTYERSASHGPQRDDWSYQFAPAVEHLDAFDQPRWQVEVSSNAWRHESGDGEEEEPVEQTLWLDAHTGSPTAWTFLTDTTAVESFASPDVVPYPELPLLGLFLPLIPIDEWVVLRHATEDLEETAWRIVDHGDTGPCRLYQLEWSTFASKTFACLSDGEITPRWKSVESGENWWRWVRVTGDASFDWRDGPSPTEFEPQRAPWQQADHPTLDLRVPPGDHPVARLMQDLANVTLPGNEFTEGAWLPRSFEWTDASALGLDSAASAVITWWSEGEIHRAQYRNAAGAWIPLPSMLPNLPGGWQPIFPETLVVDSPPLASIEVDAIKRIEAENPFFSRSRATGEWLEAVNVVVGDRCVDEEWSRISLVNGQRLYAGVGKSVFCDEADETMSRASVGPWPGPFGSPQHFATLLTP